MEKLRKSHPFLGSMSYNNHSDLFIEKMLTYLNDNSKEKIGKDMQKLQSLISYYRCAIFEVETKFRVLNEQFSLKYERNPIDSINTRLKSMESIYDKLLRKNLPINVESIETKLFDIAGIRVICSFIDDIYMLADCLLQQDDIKLIEKKDYIKNPKENGYRSLHLIIEVPIFLQDEKRMMKVEVQLRTIAMEFWANLEHKLRYKKNLPDDIMKKSANDLNECAQMSALLDEKMQNIRNIIENN